MDNTKYIKEYCERYQRGLRKTPNGIAKDTKRGDNVINFVQQSY